MTKQAKPPVRDARLPNDSASFTSHHPWLHTGEHTLRLEVGTARFHFNFAKGPPFTIVDRDIAHMATAVEGDGAFANTFLVQADESRAPSLQMTGVVDQARKKRPHSKSRRGCIPCKRRRVKCDERVPCSRCVKRNEKCARPMSREHSILPSLSPPRAHFDAEGDMQISLLHLELFHHWDKETRPTLSFPEVWPVVLQRAFDEEFVMSTVLCVAATHLTVLCPQNVKYSTASARLLTKSLRLLRQNLSRGFAKDTSDAIVGSAILINYISWCHLGFLDEQRTSETSLDLSQDQLFLLSPGVLQVYFQALPTFMTEQSVFMNMVHQHPRLNIEEALMTRGYDPARFAEPFMAMYDDPRYQTRVAPGQRNLAPSSPSLRSWQFLLGFEAELWRNQADPKQSPNSDTIARRLRVAVANMHTDNNRKPTTGGEQCSTAITRHRIPPDDPQPRSAFEQVARRLSPILCCLSISDDDYDGNNPAATPSEADLQRLFFTFPILCCGSFAEMAMNGDPRAQILLFHFYRAARILLAAKKSCWWACERSRRLETMMLKELKLLGLDVCLREDSNGSYDQTCKIYDVSCSQHI